MTWCKARKEVDHQGDDGGIRSEDSRLGRGRGRVPGPPLDGAGGEGPSEAAAVEQRAERGRETRAPGRERRGGPEHGLHVRGRGSVPPAHGTELAFGPKSGE